MQIRELFDRPGEIYKERDEESWVRYDGFIEGDQLTVEFKEIREGDWKIEFRVGGRMDARGDKAGQEVKIFATVLKAIAEFVQDRKPRIMMFTAAKEEFGQETGRARLYDRMVKRFATSAGYVSQVRDDNDRKIFILKRADTVLYNTGKPKK